MLTHADEHLKTEWSHMISLSGGFTIYFKFSNTPPFSKWNHFPSLKMQAGLSDLLLMNDVRQSDLA